MTVPNANLTVTSTGAVSTNGTLPVGTYEVGGTDSDLGGYSNYQFQSLPKSIWETYAGGIEQEEGGEEYQLLLQQAKAERKKAQTRSSIKCRFDLKPIFDLNF